MCAIKCNSFSKYQKEFKKHKIFIDTNVLFAALTNEEDHNGKPKFSNEECEHFWKFLTQANSWVSIYPGEKLYNELNHGFKSAKEENKMKIVEFITTISNLKENEDGLNFWFLKDEDVKANNKFETELKKLVENHWDNSFKKDPYIFLGVYWFDLDILLSFDEKACNKILEQFEKCFETSLNSKIIQKTNYFEFSKIEF
ncbi:hypothetical protein [Mesoplasma florum]|uniref:hypothetical protein n=1 Tax=Mesoplasma florum TaxID=2151 RepID=UPI000D0951C9|nr:hypothetical protein [Mesoplasma florum]AVN60978.1 hypothetical protein CG005_01570 [Mesoplasma florum]